MTAWHEDTGNADLLKRLRSVVEGQGRLLVFLGAGLSFGAARLRSHATFDYDRYDRWWPHDFPDADLAPDDDGLPMPSWPGWSTACSARSWSSRHPGVSGASRLLHRRRSAGLCPAVRQTVGDANYREFLLSQFDMGHHPFVQVTPSHAALVRLDLPLLFTTNYDRYRPELSARRSLGRARTHAVRCARCGLRTRAGR